MRETKRISHFKNYVSDIDIGDIDQTSINKGIDYNVSFLMKQKTILLTSTKWFFL